LELRLVSQECQAVGVSCSAGGAATRLGCGLCCGSEEVLWSSSSSGGRSRGWGCRGGGRSIRGTSRSRSRSLGLEVLRDTLQNHSNYDTVQMLVLLLSRSSHVLFVQEGGRSSLTVIKYSTALSGLLKLALIAAMHWSLGNPISIIP